MIMNAQLSLLDFLEILMLNLVLSHAFEYILEQDLLNMIFSVNCVDVIQAHRFNHVNLDEDLELLFIKF